MFPILTFIFDFSMSDRANNILYWISPLIGGILQLIPSFSILIYAARPEHGKHPTLIVVAGIALLMTLMLMMAVTYGYLFLAKRFPDRLWLLTIICFIIISGIVICIGNTVLPGKTLCSKIFFYSGEVLLFFIPVFAITYRYVSKRLCPNR